MIAFAFALTVVVEGIVAWALVRTRNVQLKNFAIQLTTWPVAQWLLWRGFAFWPIEAGVIVVEMLLWRIVLPVSLRRAALVSFATNATTAVIAVVLSRI